MRSGVERVKMQRTVVVARDAEALKLLEYIAAYKDLVSRDKLPVPS